MGTSCSCPLKGKHVLITGGSQGIGLALAREFLAEGAARVSIIARDQGKLVKAAHQLQEEFPGEASDEGVNERAAWYAADTGDSDALQAAVDAAQGDAGPIDVVVCNAGFSVPGYFADAGVDLHERHMAVNYLGTVRTIKAVLPGMMERGEGRIVIVASAAAIAGIVGYTSYAPSKAALRSLADGLRHELSATGVKVSIAYPPDTSTEGHAKELETVPAATLEVANWPEESLYTPEQVARTMIGGIKADRYHLPSPDFFQNLLVIGMTGISPKQYWIIIEMMASFILPFLTSIFAWKFDSIMKKHTKINPTLTALGEKEGLQSPPRTKDT